MLHPFRLASASAALLVTFSVGLGGCAGGAAGDDDLVDADGDAFFGNDPDPARRDCDDLPNHGEQINPGAVEKCDGIEGIIDEDKDILKIDAYPNVCDAGIIAGAQKVEHYEMASYGSVRDWAEQMGHTQAAKLLNQTLEEEKQADRKLTEIAHTLNAEAVR